MRSCSEPDIDPILLVLHGSNRHDQMNLNFWKNVTMSGDEIIRLGGDLTRSHIEEWGES